MDEGVWFQLRRGQQRSRDHGNRAIQEMVLP
jgi:hypothetical protein